jgi:hypothetical protein
LDTEKLALPMTLELYVSLDESEPRFDGNRAQQHLTKKLGMVAVALDETPVEESLMVAEDRRLSVLFHYWLARHKDAIQVDSKGPVILRPPVWYQWLIGQLPVSSVDGVRSRFTRDRRLQPYGIRTMVVRTS